MKAGTEVRRLLDSERQIVGQPAAVRDRALARARAALAAGARGKPFDAPDRIGWGGVVGLAAVALAGLTGGYHLQARLSEPAAAAALAPAAPSPASPPNDAPVSNVGDPALLQSPTPPADDDRSGLEAELLHRASAALARGQFGAVLSFVREHQRRFRHGLLVEEREALRVWALAGLPRHADAHRAAAAFKARFPDSSLLPAVASAVDAPPGRAAHGGIEARIP